MAQRLTVIAVSLFIAIGIGVGAYFAFRPRPEFIETTEAAEDEVVMSSDLAQFSFGGSPNNMEGSLTTGEDRDAESQPSPTTTEEPTSQSTISTTTSFRGTVQEDGITLPNSLENNSTTSGPTASDPTTSSSTTSPTTSSSTTSSSTTSSLTTTLKMFDASDVQGSITTSQTTLANGNVLYELKFVDFAAPDCPELTLVLFNADNPNIQEIEIPLTSADKRTFSKPLPDSFVPAFFTSIRLDCADTSVSGDTQATAAPVDPEVKSGTFSGSGHYRVEGSMSIVRSTTFDGDGSSQVSYSLRFRNLYVDSGPDVVLYLTPQAGPLNPNTAGTLLVPIDGRPRGTISKNGDYSQPLGANFNPNDYNGALVWCRAFSAFFGNLSFDP